STALPPGQGVSPVAINYFFQNISDARAQFVQRIIANPSGDYDTQRGSFVEFELDTEMQSVGAPGADSITLVVSPASQVFTVGANDIANNMPTVTAVSISLGICEDLQTEINLQTGFNEFTALRNAVI